MRREIFRQGDPRFLDRKSRESVRQRQSNGYRPPRKPLSIGDAPEVGLSDLSFARNSSSLSSKRGSAVRNLLWESPLSFVQDLFNKVRTAGVSWLGNVKLLVGKVFRWHLKDGSAVQWICTFTQIHKVETNSHSLIVLKRVRSRFSQRSRGGSCSCAVFWSHLQELYFWDGGPVFSKHQKVGLASFFGHFAPPQL